MIYLNEIMEHILITQDQGAENSVMNCLVWTMLSFKKISIMIVNMWQWDLEKYCWIRFGLHTCT